MPRQARSTCWKHRSEKSGRSEFAVFFFENLAVYGCNLVDRWYNSTQQSTDPLRTQLRFLPSWL